MEDWNNHAFLAARRAELDRRLGKFWEEIDRVLFVIPPPDLPVRFDGYYGSAKLVRYEYCKHSLGLSVSFDPDQRLKVSVELRCLHTSRVKIFYGKYGPEFRCSDLMDQDNKYDFVDYLALSERHFLLLRAIQDLDFRKVDVHFMPGELMELTIAQRGVLPLLRCIVADHLTIVFVERYVLKPTADPEFNSATHFDHIKDVLVFLKSHFK